MFLNGDSKRMFRLLVVGTFLVLGYVHGQVSILRASYAIEKKEREVARLNEEYKLAKFQLARIHSPGFLSKELKSKSLNLAAPKAVQVVRVLKPRVVTAGLDRTQAPAAKPNVFSWMSFSREAQAKSSNK